MSMFSRSAIAIALVAASCGSDPEIPIPPLHDCFLTINAPVRPEPITISSAASELSGGFLGEVQPGQQIRLYSSGEPAANDLVLIGPVISREQPGSVVTIIPAEQGARTFAAPTDAGSYQLISQEEGVSRVLGELEVVATPVSLCSSGDVGPGGLVTAVWTGPGDPGDIVELFDPVENTVLQVAGASGAAWEVNATKLQSPQTVGQYMVRYRKADGVVQVTTDFVVSLRSELGTLRAPTTAGAGEVIVAQWIGPPRPGHMIRVIEAETDREVVSAPIRDEGYGGGSVELEAPAPGAYRIEYSKPEGGPPGGRQDLVVTGNDA